MLLLWGEKAKQVSPYGSILTLIIGGSCTYALCPPNKQTLCNLRCLIICIDRGFDTMKGAIMFKVIQEIWALKSDFFQSQRRNVRVQGSNKNFEE